MQDIISILTPREIGEVLYSVRVEDFEFAWISALQLLQVALNRAILIRGRRKAPTEASTSRGEEPHSKVHACHFFWILTEDSGVSP